MITRISSEGAGVVVGCPERAGLACLGVGRRCKGDGTQVIR